MFTCARAVRGKQSGVEMQGRERRAAGLGDGTVCGGEEKSLKEEKM